MNYRKMLKEMFPFLYEEYLSIQRKRLISLIEKRKKMDREELKKIIMYQYKCIFGHTINWEEPKNYTEKIQWSKFYDTDPQKTLLSDKYMVREWVEKEIGKEYLIGLLGVWNKFDEIDFSKLPHKFVLKTNHGSGTNIIVKDKSSLDIKNTKRKIEDWLNTDFGYKSMEFHYSGITPMIIAEEYVETEYGELQDYKFLCFNGKPYYCWVDIGRYSNHTRNVYDLNWNLQPWNQEQFAHYPEAIPKPKNFEKMVEIATILSSGFSHVRVDLYNVDGKIYFGEMTFTNGSGLDRIIPEQYDLMLGNLWKI